MGKFTMGLRRSSPTILTALGIVGVVGTAVTAVRATPKALRLIKAKKDELETDELTPIDWHRYVYCWYWCNGQAQSGGFDERIRYA